MRHSELAGWGVIIIILAVTTFFTSASPYSSLWFAALWLSAGAALLYSIIRVKMWRRPIALLIHSSLILIILSGLLSAFTVKRGTIFLPPDGAEQHSLILPDGTPLALPEPLSLISFCDSTFESRLIIAGDTEEILAVNRPLILGTYRFLQADFTPDGGSILSVSVDPFHAENLLHLSFLLLIIGLTISTARRLRRSEMSSFVKINIGLFILIGVGLIFGCTIFLLRWNKAGIFPVFDGPGALSLLSLMLMVCSLWLTLSRHNSPALYLFLLSIIIEVSTYFIPGSDSETIAPILRSPWLAVHVTLVIASYALLFADVVISILTLFTHSDHQKNLTLTLLYSAISLLVAGIATGSFWASEAWGRPWAWDPKETWALITLMVYIIPLHYRFSSRHLALFMIISFLAVLMTFAGVNFLSSIHAY